MGRLWKVIGVVFFTWTFYTIDEQQMFPDFYTHLFDNVKRGEQIYGALNSAQVFLEAVMMGVVPLLMRKIGVRNVLLLGFVMMSARILGTAVFSDVVALSVVKMFHALEAPLCILGCIPILHNSLQFCLVSDALPGTVPSHIPTRSDSYITPAGRPARSSR